MNKKTASRLLQQRSVLIFPPAGINHQSNIHIQGGKS